MSRATNAPASRERRRRVIDAAKGFRASRKHYRMAQEAVDRAMAMSTRARIERKRDYRALWIQRINAAVRALNDDTVKSYSKFISGLTKAGIALNRKALSEIAIADAEGFKALVAQAKAALA